MDLTNAIGYLLEEPAVKTKHRMKMEKEFFASSGLTYATDGDSKHLILDLDTASAMLSNEFMWLRVIHEHTDVRYTINLTGEKGTFSETVLAGQDPERVLKSLMRQAVQWKLGGRYTVAYDGYVSMCGNQVYEDESFTVDVISEDGIVAYGSNDYAYHVTDLLSGDIAKTF